MKILFLSHIYKEKHDILVRGLSEVLNRHNYSVDHEPQNSTSFDCIFVFNRKALKKHETILQKRQSPVIYLFCLSDTAEEYVVSNIITQTMIIKDKPLNVSLLLSPILYLDISLPSYIPPKPAISNKKSLIYVRIEDDYLGENTFLKLLPLLNQLDKYTIHYQSNHAVGRHLLNPHIKFIPQKHDMIEEINQVDIVIGSGLVAAFALRQGKKTIVIGERGYGGLVTVENLEYHLSNCFQGRNGGKLDEMIPAQLVAAAIETKNSNLQKIAEQLSVLQIQNENRFIQRIERTVSLNNQVRLNDPTLHYKLNPDYKITKKGKRFWLYKYVFGTLYKCLNASETAVISAFREPHSMREVLDTFPKEYEEHIVEYVQELIAEKILVPTSTNTVISWGFIPNDREL